MPELPEVETVKRTLEKKIVGLTITGVEIIMPKVIRDSTPENFTNTTTGKKISRLARRGKYLMIYLTGEIVMLIHLRMTGRLVYCSSEEPLPRHTHVIFKLSDGSDLRFNDVRQFGQIIISTTKNLDKIKGFKDLGPEPLDPGFTRDFLRKELKRKRTRIKPLLLDQTFVAGLGNIYVDEALHRARLHPERLARTLSSREVANLYHSIIEVLNEGIENRGTSMRDYVDGDGRTGNYQNLLRIYNREGERCTKCGAVIERMKVGGRSSYYCPACQKE